MSVTVYFEGICTHVRKDPKYLRWLPVPHRVVLANARQVKHHPHIPDHEGTLAIDPKYVLEVPAKTSYLEPKPGAADYTWLIHGATVTIPSDDDALTYPAPACMPRLPGAPHFAPKRRILDDKLATKEDVDFFFDIDRGKLRDCCFGDAYGAKLELRNVGAVPKIAIRPFRGEAETWILLTPGAEVIVRHTARECTTDDDHHFLLHYLIGGTRKLPKTLPELTPCKRRKACKSCMAGDVVSLGVGCSSSNFP